MRMLLLFLCLFSFNCSAASNELVIHENDYQFDFMPDSTQNTNKFDLRQMINDCHVSYQWFSLSMILVGVFCTTCLLIMIYLLYCSRF